MTFRIAALTAAAAVLAAATGASAATAPQPRPQASTASASTAATSTPSCSWLARSDDDTVNAAYPDTSATYWLTSFTLAAGQTLRIHGVYAKARYFSFHTYTSTGLVEDSRYDAQIRASHGSGNPFRHKVSADSHRRYVVTVRAGAVPKHRTRNTVYTGTLPKSGAPILSGTLIYRVYTPTHPASAQGSVPLPAISVRSSSGATIARQAGCATKQPTTGGAIDKVYDSPGYPSSGPPIPIPQAKRVPVWKRASSNLQVAGMFGNQQNAYLTTRTSLQYGDVLVIHAKAPTFPNTAKGVPAYHRAQVRYWSICQNSITTRVIACVPDSKAPRRHGDYTIVISTAAARPTTATRSHGVAWIPWGAQPDGMLIYRNMVAAASFTHATQRVAAGATPVAAGGNAKRIMAAYYPKSHYCSTASYDANGPLRCTA
jgi:hypothetical protein